MLSMNNFFMKRPSRDLIQQLLIEQRNVPLSYQLIGASDGTPPPGWHWHSQSIRIGSGETDWEHAKAALQSWTQFDMRWVFPLDRTVPLRIGENFVFTANHLGLWSVNVCRIVHTIDDVRGSVERFGFAYGTLATHALRGEELFLLERDRGTQEVRFAIQKFSRPNVWLARAAAPVTRHIQARFTHDALHRLAREVADE
jgi:uncharacterized protein (UPF0548 family)